MKFEYFGESHPTDPFTGRPALADLGTAINVGGSLLSGAMGSDAASNAADASAKATAESNAMLQKQMGDNSAAYSPYTTTGTAANNKLSYYLGLTPTSSKTSAPTTSQVGQSNDPLWEKIISDYQAAHQAKYGKTMDRSWDAGADEQAQYQKLKALYDSQVQATPLDTSDGNYGSLLKNFSASDLANDPVYNSGLQFGLDQGVQGLNRQAAAGGSLNSGATLKALTKYANDYGSTKAQQAYNNFNTNKSTLYGMLSGQQNTGLNATNSLTGNNTSLLTGQANNTMANGQTQAQADIASGAGWANAINGGIGNYLYQNRTSTPANASISSSGGYASGNGMYSSGTPWYLKS